MKENKNKENRDYWKPEEEEIIKQWADKALCYQWMHARCREIYQKKCMVHYTSYNHFNCNRNS